MAKQSSRELVLERRKALSQGGKKAVAVNSSKENRVRSAADSRATRTDANVVAPRKSSSKMTISSAYSSSNISSASPVSGRNIKRVSQPSRELVLARREALSRRGKTADTSKDRTRVDVENKSVSSTPESAPITKYCCDECKDRDSDSIDSTKSLSSSKRSPELTSRSMSRRTTTKRRAIQNSSRALVLARREAQSKHGKTAGKQPTSAASVETQMQARRTNSTI